MLFLVYHNYKKEVFLMFSQSLLFPLTQIFPKRTDCFNLKSAYKGIHI